LRGDHLSRSQVVGNFERVAGTYDGNEAVFSGPIADRLIQVSGIRPGDRVLDVGCGTGSALVRAAAAARPGGEVTGVDFSPAMLAVARDRAERAGLDGIELVVGDAEDPPDPPCGEGSFDRVIASLVFFLLPHPAGAARRWLDLLRPGGTVTLSWNVSEDPAWAPVLAVADRHVPPGFPRFGQLVRHWPLGSVAELERMLAECGYTDITTVTEDIRSRYPSPVAWWEFSWSRACRISWQHIPADRLPAVRAEVLALLDRQRDPADGSVTRTIRFGWTSARRRREE
jgi:ubiquinone/menaquinone biosynthesis C-methylase UbiE